LPEWRTLLPALRAHDIAVSDRDMPRPVGGGDISAAWRLRSGDSSVFLKTGPADAWDRFAAEADGLSELARAGALRVPKVLGCIRSAGECMLALEWIEFDLPQPGTEARLGEKLAEQHRHTSDRFGWHRDNTIGLTPQPNPWSEDWVEFLCRERLGFQLELARSNGYSGELQRAGSRLLAQLGRFFDDYWPEPSLLHGDLWGGNWASAQGEPVIFDPAVYYGDREFDLAMTRLFGGFGPDFYRAYDASWPLAHGSDKRVGLYQLYHVLNHLNLFGSGYLGRAVGILKSLLGPA
jgi:fructosamine-3-kinase